jgi:hypothetical protein
MHSMIRGATMNILPALLLIGAVFVGQTSAQLIDPPSGPGAPYTTPAPQPGPRWPMRVDSPGGQITIYQPQLTSFDGNSIKARAAVSVVAPGQQEPTFGAIWMESRVSTDRVARTVQIIDVNVTRVRFPGPGGLNEQAFTDALRSANAQQPPTLSLDQLLEELQVIQKEKAAVKDLSNEPPRILFVTHPAVLVQYDGQPKLMQVPNSNLIRAVNTPFFVVLDPQSKTYFLKGGNRWFAAGNPLGPFQNSAGAPEPVVALANGSGYQDPQAPLSETQAAGTEILTATDPTELVWTDGPEEMGTVPNTELLYVSNTASDVFMLIDTQQVFVLLSGRWYVAPNHNGPWTNVPPDKLPADFQRIPPNSQKGDVLAHVVGTQQAKDAVADTYVPQTAAIDRHNFEQPPVTYDGDPNFQPIETTPVSYAVNTPNSVLRVGGRYYCCYNAVWYLAAAANGPWDLCTAVPAEIYAIPPRYPVYSVRYCYVYESTPDVVYCGYTPGYVGCYPFDHVVVYGTGYRYEPWIGRTYYARPHTFGFAAHYDSYSGHWGFDVGLALGGGDFWFGNNDEHRRAPLNEWFGHGGYRPAYVRDDVHIRRDVTLNRVEVRNENINLYARRKDIRGDLPRQAEIRHVDAGTVERRDGVRAGEPPRAPIGAHRSEPVREQPRNDVFAGPNGDVYRRGTDGWEQRDGNNKWVARDEPKAPERQAPDRPAPAPEHHEAPAAHESDANLNQEYHARVAGQQREHDYQPPRQAGGRQVDTPAPRTGNDQSHGGGNNDSHNGGQSSGNNQHH